MSSTVSVYSCLDGLINDKPFMPWGTPTQQAAALMELAGNAYELQCGSVDPNMVGYIQREISAATVGEPALASA